MLVRTRMLILPSRKPIKSAYFCKLTEKYDHWSNTKCQIFTVLHSSSSVLSMTDRQGTDVKTHIGDERVEARQTPPAVDPSTSLRDSVLTGNAADVKTLIQDGASAI